MNSVVGSFLAPNERFSRKDSHLFQILVTLVTISNWPWWVSWQHFYSQSLPTKKLQATLPFRLPWRQATPQNIICNSFVSLTFKRTGARGKSWSRQIYVYDLNLLPQLLAQHEFYRVTLDQFFPQQFKLNPSFNGLGILNNFVSAHVCFNNFDAYKYVCILCKYVCK